MEKEDFVANKDLLIKSINSYLIDTNIIGEERASLIRLLELVKKYSYENRLEVKGLISYAMRDNLEIDNSPLEIEIYKFDNDIK